MGVTNEAIGSLFEPYQLGAVRLSNRVVMAPMTRNRAGPGDAPTTMNVEYYRQRAGAGLIISEASQVSGQAKGYPHTPGNFTPEQVRGWRRVTDAVHDAGGRMFLQLWHVGRISHPSHQPGGALPVAPSAVLPRGYAVTSDGPQPYVMPRALHVDEISGVIAQFAAGASNALAAGFDGVELHAANGYLIDQFLRNGANLRDDAYGGSHENRTRFLIQVVEAVSDVVGADRISVRLSPASSFNDMSDDDPQALFEYVAARLSGYGLACLHVVEESVLPDFDFGALRRAFRGRYMVNGGYDRDRAANAIATGYTDLVSFGAPFISNPDLVERLRRGAALAQGDRASFYGGDERGYIDYPSLAAAG